MVRIPEWDLVLPTLFVLNYSENNFINTTNLIKELRIILKPTWEDLKILSWRSDDKFSQKVRNLKSHNTLKWYADYISNWNWFKITTKWIEYLKENIDILEYLVENDFEWNDIKDWLNKVYVLTSKENKKIEIFDENIIIKEWIEKFRKVKIYERSNILRNRAIDFFKKEDWNLYCECCSFSFDLFYWNNISKNYIEIHHKRPIFQYEWEDINKNIESALANLAPLCSNCHRMIHKEKNTRNIEYIIEAIRNNWNFILFK